MIISCPSCNTRFVVAATALGPAGRTVRCSNCRHTWHQMPVADDVATAAPLAAAPTVAPAAEPAAATGPALRAEPEAAAAGRGKAAVPTLPRRRRAIAATLAWAFLGIVVVVVAGGIVLFRDHVVAALPAAAPIYAAVGLMEDPHAGLELRRVTSREISRNGARVLMVEGEVANNTAKQREVPRMRGRLFDERDGELRNWTFSVPDPRLSPGENTRFLTELENPPAGAVRLTILFDAP